MNTRTKNIIMSLATRENAREYAVEQDKFLFAYDLLQGAGINICLTTNPDKADTYCNILEDMLDTVYYETNRN